MLVGLSRLISAEYGIACFPLIADLIGGSAHSNLKVQSGRSGVLTKQPQAALILKPGYGISWGGRGFRIGRSQYGNWWISVGLPFGFRITKRLGGPMHKQRRVPKSAAELPPAEAWPQDRELAAPENETPNQRVLRELLDNARK